MHVFVCSYEFDLGAEGVCTGRLVRALLEAGCEVSLATSPYGRTGLGHPRLTYHVVSAWPTRGGRLFFRLAPAMGHIPTRHGYLWSRRVAKLKLKGQPDIVYGRAQPFQSVAAAHGLARNHQLTLWAHFSDPMPSPFWDTDSAEYRPTLVAVRRLLYESQALTFTTHQALTYQAQMLDEHLSTKAFVLNHIAPEPSFLQPKRPAAGKVFGYFGLFYGKRNASALLRGFKQHLQLNPFDSFLFVGTHPETVLPQAAELGISANVRVLPRVDQVRHAMTEVDVLVATDSFSAPPVFLSTKLVEYLVVNRTVLLISPKQSPGAQLLVQAPQSCILVDAEETEAVRRGLASAAACAANTPAFDQRFALMTPFSGSSVAAQFLEQAAIKNQIKSRN